MIYVPDLNYSYYFTNNDYSIIYATNSSLVNGSNIPVRKYFVNSHYDFVDSTLEYTENFDIINNSRLIDNWFYRKDSVDISLLVVIFSVFFFYIPIKIFSKLFKRGGF